MSETAKKEGVYVLKKGAEAVYVGQSTNIYFRIGQHIQEGTKDFDSFAFYETPDYDRLEKFLISAFKPKYNSVSRHHPCFSADPEVFPKPTPVTERPRSIINEEYITDKEIAEDMGVHEEWVSDAILRHPNRVHRWRNPFDGIWRIDREWYKEHKKEVRKWVLDGV